MTNYATVLLSDFGGGTYCNSSLSLKADDSGSLYNNEEEGRNCYYSLQVA